MQNSLAHMSMPHHRDFAFDVPKDNSKLGIPTANGARQRLTSACYSDADLRAICLSAVCMGDGVLSLTSRLALLLWTLWRSMLTCVHLSAQRRICHASQHRLLD